ncbi:MAG: hypothetical protein OXP74_12690 [Acidobacteriota bacterium]|nr:hypothetical protein [Acidobacteriota bacterium]
MPPQLERHAYPRFFVSADWSKEPGKRAVYVADLGERRIFREARPDWRFDSLMDLAEELSAEGSVVVGVDVVLGVPRSYWKLVLADSRYGHPTNFVDWLGRLGGNQEFFNPANTARNHEQWRVDRPWFHVPKGKGALTAFKKKADDGFLRLIDRSSGAKPLFAVSGIPGTVGSGTRDFWRELAPNLRTNRKFAVWPFEGELAELLSTNRVVLAETYPGLAYAAALAEELPTGRFVVAKTKQQPRNDACNLLAASKWVTTYGVNLGDLDSARNDEDDFDALFTAAAVLRCALEHTSLTTPDWMDHIAEGAMLLAGPVDPTRRSRTIPKPDKALQDKAQLPLAAAPKKELRPPEPRQRTPGEKVTYRCPIPGCSKVFSDSRGGWDAHVASQRRHPDWFPDIKDPRLRKELFRRDFGYWFR